MNEDNSGSLQPQQPVAVSSVPPPSDISNLVQQSMPPSPPVNAAPVQAPPVQIPVQPAQISASPPPPQASSPPPQVSPPPVVQPAAAPLVAASPAQAPAQAPVSMPQSANAPQAIAPLPLAQPVQQPTPPVAPPQASPEPAPADTPPVLPQSPYGKPDIDIRPTATFQQVIQGTPESFAEPVEPQIVNATPLPTPHPDAEVAIETSPTTPDGTPVPAHKRLVPPSEEPGQNQGQDGQGEEPIPDSPVSSTQAAVSSAGPFFSSEETKEKSKDKHSEGVSDPATSLGSINEASSVKVDKQISSTGRKIDVSKIENPPRKPRKLGGLFVFVTVVGVLGAAGFFALDYISQNIQERTISCLTSAKADAEAKIPAYGATLKIDLTGKNPTAANTMYTFNYGSQTEADGVAPKTIVGMVEDLNKDYKDYINNIDTPRSSGSKTTTTVNYKPDAFMSGLLGDSALTESVDDILTATSSKLTGMGYTCAVENK